MKKIYIFLMLIAFVVSACTFNVEVLTPEPLTPAVMTPSGDVGVFPTATPAQVLPAPQFSNTRFTVDVNANVYQTTFPARTRRIYAVWDYQNMREGMIVRRDWYYNNVLWITREEPWDFSTYGANGTLRDISVYDLDIGLESGEYRFELYIDMKPQPIGEGGWPQFTIDSRGSEARVTSPNGQSVADADDPRILLLRDTGRSIRQLFSGNEITNLTWLPDSRHILFVDRDRSQQVTGLRVGIHDDLWIVEIVSGELHLLYKNSALFRKFVLSPDSHYFASIEGSGFGDACFQDSRLIFFELSSDFQSARSIKQEQFTGIPAIPDSVIYPVEDGRWESETQYLVPLNRTCSADQNFAGSYLFDVPSLTVVKK